MNARRRPTKFSERKFAELLNLIREGATIEKATGEDGMPRRLTLYDWLRADPQVRSRFDQAVEDRNMTWKDQAVSLYADLMRRLRAGEMIDKDEVTSAKAFANFLSQQSARTERAQTTKTKAAGPAGPGGIRVELVTFDAPLAETPDALEMEEPEGYYEGDQFDDDGPDEEVME